MPLTKAHVTASARAELSSTLMLALEKSIAGLRQKTLNPKA